MKMTMRTSAILLCGLGAIAAIPPAFAEAEPGFYLGLSAGQATYDINEEELNVNPLSSSLDDSDTAFSLVGGYRLNEFIAVEAGYVNLGTAEYRSVAIVASTPTVRGPVSLDIDFKASGFTTVGIASLPLGERFDLHGRFGILFAESKAKISSANLSGSPFTVRTTSSGQSTEVLYGAGGAFHLGSNWSLSLDWQRYAKVGDDDVTKEADIDAISLTAFYRFP